MQDADTFLKKAVDLSGKSLDAGEFPAGAVLVTQSGTAYESDPSLPHSHGEMMVIDKAIATEGAPLTGAVMYASMEPCLMCSAKMYWSGVTEVHYVIPKSKTNVEYAYEDAIDMNEHLKSFFTKIEAVQYEPLLNEALGHYKAWVQKIEENHHE